jgi:hypothetical protein
MYHFDNKTEVKQSTEASAAKSTDMSVTDGYEQSLENLAAEDLSDLAMPEFGLSDDEYDIVDESNVKALKVNPKYWYDEDDIKAVIIQNLQKDRLKLDDDKNYIITKDDGSLHEIDGRSYSLGHQILLASYNHSTVEEQAKIDLFKNSIANLIAWNDKQQASGADKGLIIKHTLAVPVNANKIHWALLELEFEIIRKANGQFSLAPKIELFIYDSLSIVKCANVKELIAAVLNDFVIDLPIQFLLYDVKIKQQPAKDSVSCGLITAVNAGDIFSGKDIPLAPSAEPYYDERVLFDLRCDHVRLIAGFSDKQTTEKIYTDPVNEYSGVNIEQTAEDLFDFVKKQRCPEHQKHFHQLIREFIEEDEAANSFTGFVHTMGTVVATTETAAETFDFGEPKTLKEWFQCNYSALTKFEMERNIKLLSLFFKVNPDRKESDDLEWVGKGELLEVARDIIELCNPLIYVRYNDKHERYSYAGHIDNQGRPHGIGTEYIKDFGTYNGNFNHGVRVGEGYEINYIDKLGISLYFNGIRNDQSELWTGKIACFIGGKMSIGGVVCYEGAIHEGKMHGPGYFVIFDNKGQRWKLAVIHEQGKFKEAIETDITDKEFNEQVAVHIYGGVPIFSLYNYPAMLPHLRRSMQLCSLSPLYREKRKAVESQTGSPMLHILKRSKARVVEHAALSSEEEEMDFAAKDTTEQLIDYSSMSDQDLIRTYFRSLRAGEYSDNISIHPCLIEAVKRAKTDQSKVVILKALKECSKTDSQKEEIIVLIARLETFARASSHLQHRKI